MSEWISVKERLPIPGKKVLIVQDVSKWAPLRPKRIEIATTGFLAEETIVGGPNSLTGYHKLSGIYFAVPAILHPESVTHWMDLPEPPTVFK